MKWYRSIPILLFLVLIIIPSVSAMVYKWLDEKGVVHYSDKPPENKEHVQEVTTPHSAPLESVNGTQRLKRKLEEQNKTEYSKSINERNVQQEQDEAHQHISQRIKSCGRARQELITLKNGRAFRYDENNARVFLDDETWNAETSRLNAFIEAECNDSPEELHLQQLEAERFKTQQNIEDNCVLARDRLMLMDNLDAHTPIPELKKAKQNVDSWCKNATGDKTIILRRNIIRQ